MDTNAFHIQNIHISSDCIIPIRQITVFPHGLDGLHLWEAGIVLTRYLHYKILQESKPQLIVDLGTGVGIAGLLASQKCRVIMTDYSEEILDNAWANVLLNKVACTILRLDWREYSKITFQCDCIVGSDLVYNGAPLMDLYETVKKLLKSRGRFYLIIPDQRMCAQQFIDIMKSEDFFEILVEPIIEPKYYEKCLQDEVQSQKLYPGLSELNMIFLFIVFITTHCSTISQESNLKAKGDDKQFEYTYEYVEEFRYEEYTEIEQLELQPDLAGEYDEKEGFGDGLNIYRENEEKDIDSQKAEEIGFGNGDEVNDEQNDEGNVDQAGFGLGQDIYTEETVKQQDGFGEGLNLYKSEQSKEVNGFGKGTEIYQEQMLQEQQEVGFGEELGSLKDFEDKEMDRNEKKLVHNQQY